MYLVPLLILAQRGWCFEIYSTDYDFFSLSSKFFLFDSLMLQVHIGTKGVLKSMTIKNIFSDSYTVIVPSSHLLNESVKECTRRNLREQ